MTQLSVKLVIGRLQRRLVQKFTSIEVAAFTIWGLITNLSWYLLIIYGINQATFLIFVLLQALAVGQLFVFLEREHTIATEAGNAGPEV